LKYKFFKKKIAVAMSGGVDSSVAALLLKKAGYNVTGITMRIWPCKPALDSGSVVKKACCSISDTEDAKKTAAKIVIPHYIIDLRSAFEKKVIRPFCDDYLSGKTPNPCISCNEHIKFGYLLKKAKSLGIETMATGHYARIGVTGRGPVLKRAADASVDQSYWLYSVPLAALESTVFPLGDISKEEVRSIARKYGLPTAEKPKSTEICFIPGNDYRKFVMDHEGIKARPGKIVDSSGRTIGRHKGLFNYTVGQRHGLGSLGGRKMYVMRIIPAKNVIVAGGEEETLGKRMTVGRLRTNPALIKEGKLSYNVAVKIRNQHIPAQARLNVTDANNAEIIFSEPQRSITPGQAAVFYTGDAVLGGGTILGWKK
jgi:tRNA-specific 2-thiouridylase